MGRVGADGIFRKVKVRMWRSGSFSRLSPMPPSGQGLWLYLLTCPESCSIPGAIVAGRAQLAEALDWPVEKFAECWGEIASESMAVADWSARLVWLPRGPYENPPNNPNVVKAWAQVFRTLPDCELKARIYCDLRDFMKAFGEAFAEAFAEAFGKAVTKALPKARAKGGVPRERERENKEGEGIPPSAATQPFPPGGTTAAATPEEPEFPPDDPDEEADDLPPNPDPEPVPEPEASAYPWHPEDERDFGNPEKPHPRWGEYVELLHDGKMPQPWPRFLPWLSEDIKKRAPLAAAGEKALAAAANPMNSAKPLEPQGDSHAQTGT